MLSASGFPVLPVRNTKYIEDKHQFDELGILDTLGYFDFPNLKRPQRLPYFESDTTTPPINVPSLNNESPLYVVKASNRQ